MYGSFLYAIVPNVTKEQRAGNPDPPSLYVRFSTHVFSPQHTSKLVCVRLTENVKAIGLHLAQFLVALVAQFGVALRGDEEFFGLLGEGLHQRVVAHLAHDEVAELAPVGLL